MEITTEQEILSNIIEYTNLNKHISFKAINSWHEYFNIRGRRRIIKLIINSLRAGERKLFKSYCKDVLHNRQQLTKVLICSTLRKSINFYKIDLDIVESMLNEYENYIISGNFFNNPRN